MDELTVKPNGQKEGRSLRTEYLFTAAICSSYFANAMMYMILGPTMLDVAELSASSYDDAAFAIVVREAAFLFGSLACGWIFDHWLNQRIGLMLSLAVAAIATAVVPFSSNLWLLWVSQGVVGFAIAGLDVAATVWMLQTWTGHNVDPFMQAMQAAYAIGQMIIPILSAPFLSSEQEIPEFIVRNEWAYFVKSYLKKEGTHIIYPYTIASLCGFASAGFVLFLHLRTPFTREVVVTGNEAEVRPMRKAKSYGSTEDVRKTSIAEPEPPVVQTTAPAVKRAVSMSPADPDSLVKRRRGYWILIVLLECLFICSYTGMECDTFTFIPQFVVFSDLEVSKSTAALMSSVMSASFALFRILSVPLATRISPGLMLWNNMTLTFIGNVLLLIFANSSYAMTWIALLLLGSGLSSTMGATNAFVSQRIVMTNTLVGLFLCFGRVAATANAFFIRLLIQSQPLILAHTNILFVIICAMALIAFHVTDRWDAGRKNKSLEAPVVCP